MKLRFVTILFLTMILAAPLAAGATDCCFKEGTVATGPGGAMVTPNSCILKSASACDSAYTQLDCSTKPECQNQLPICCVYKFNDTNLQNYCHESTDRTFTCAGGVQPANTTFTRQSAKCAEIADCKEAGTNVEDPGPPPAEFPIIAPKLNVHIPTLPIQAFANVTQKDGYIYIPFISVYLVAAYKLGVSIAAILAVIMIMVGGFIWIAAGGDSGKIGQAKTMISGAVVGLLLTVGSYVALNTINPDLVNFTALKIPIVTPRTVEVVFDDYDYEAVGNADVQMSTTSPSQYDPIFKKYAPCAGITPEALKAIAQAESGLNANAGQGSFVGLFQIGKKYCPQKVASYCEDLTNPDNNTAVAAAMIKSSVDKIKAKCPASTSPYDQMIMIYIGHNNGPGALNLAIKDGCDTDQMKETLTKYYATNPTGISTANKYTSTAKPGIACLGDRTDIQSRAECTAGPKFDFTKRLADKSKDLTQVIASGPNGTCPY